MSAHIVDLESRRPGHSLARVRAALAGCFDVTQLSNDEAILFYDLLGAAQAVPSAAEIEAYRAFGIPV